MHGELPGLGVARRNGRRHDRGGGEISIVADYTLVGMKWTHKPAYCKELLHETQQSGPPRGQALRLRQCR